MKLFPAIPHILTCVLQAAYDQGVRLVVIDAFGCGNGPEAITNWVNSKSDVYLAIVTQCSEGFVANTYSASLGNVRDRNRLALCRDMSFECAVAKLWVLKENGFALAPLVDHSHGPRNRMESSLRGELTDDPCN